jgi:hypothetical protein
LRWIGLALLGLAVAAAVSIAASQLASQQVGLASQPISAGDALAPAGAEGRPRAKSRQAHRKQVPPPAAQAPASLPEASSPEGGDRDEGLDEDADD